MTLENAIINHAKEEHRKIDTMINDYIRILDKFERIGIHEKANDYWQKYYISQRVIRGTLSVHCLDAYAFDFANRQTEQYYNSIRDNYNRKEDWLIWIK